MDDEDRRDEEARVCHLILSSLSDKVQIHRHFVVAFTKATDDNNSYFMYEITEVENSRSSNYCWTLKDQYLRRTHHRRKYSAIFDPEQSGTVKIDDMFVMIIVNSSRTTDLCS